jgi:hypothetical protein
VDANTVEMDIYIRANDLVDYTYKDFQKTKGQQVVRRTSTPVLPKMLSIYLMITTCIICIHKNLELAGMMK